MGLTPQEFWATSLAEYMARVDGHNRFERGGVEPMTRARLNELIAEYGEPSQSIRKKPNAD